MKPYLLSLLLILPIAAITPAQVQGPPAAVAAPLQIDPLVFDPPLPTEPIATVLGREVPAAEMLKLVLEQNFQNSVSTLMLGLMLESELARQEKTISEEGVNEELKVMLEQSAPGATIEGLRKTSPDTLAQRTMTARIHRGWQVL
jgi:hypothetical protein